MYADADVGDKHSSRGFEIILHEQQLHGSTILPEPHPSPSQARIAAEQLQLQSYVNRLAMALVSSRTPYVKKSNDRASASASQIDVADYTNTTTTAAPEAASPFFSKKKWKVFWMIAIAVVATFMSAFMTTITVVVKQQHKKIEMKELCRDIKLDGLDGDERPDPINTDLLVSAAAPVDDAAGDVKRLSPHGITRRFLPGCTAGGDNCIANGSSCIGSCNDCCSCININCGSNGKYCAASDTTQCPTPTPPPPTPSCIPSLTDCIQNGNSYNSEAVCQGQNNGNQCCSCAATECTQNNFYCTATAGTTDQCPSSAPSRMVSVVCIEI